MVVSSGAVIAIVYGCLAVAIHLGLAVHLLTGIASIDAVLVQAALAMTGVLIVEADVHPISGDSMWKLAV